MSEMIDINSKYTFWKLLNEYKVVIPIIQRDYAQGRTSDNATAIRAELLESIHTALINGESLDFDFVYGMYRDPSTDPYKITPKVYAGTRNTKTLANPMTLLNVASIMRDADPGSGAGGTLCHVGNGEISVRGIEGYI